MNKFEINYKFSPGDSVWFLSDNKVSKGVVDYLEFAFKTPGLSSRGYKVKEIFNNLFFVPKKDKKIDGWIRYNINLLHFDSEEYQSSPHYFFDYENKLFSTKKDLLDSLK